MLPGEQSTNPLLSKQVTTTCSLEQCIISTLLPGIWVEWHPAVVCVMCVWQGLLGPCIQPPTPDHHHHQQQQPTSEVPAALFSCIQLLAQLWLNRCCLPMKNQKMRMTQSKSECYSRGLGCLRMPECCTFVNGFVSPGCMFTIVS